MDKFTSNGKSGRRSKQVDDLILSDTMDGETVVGSGRNLLIGRKEPAATDHFSPSNSRPSSGRRKTGAGPITSNLEPLHGGRRQRGAEIPSFLKAGPNSPAYTQSNTTHATGRRASPEIDLCPSSSLASKRSPSSGFDCENAPSTDSWKFQRDSIVGLRKDSASSHRDSPMIPSRRSPSGGTETYPKDYGIAGTGHRSTASPSGSLSDNIESISLLEKPSQGPDDKKFPDLPTSGPTSYPAPPSYQAGYSANPSVSRDNHHHSRHRKDREDFSFSSSDQKGRAPALTEEEEVKKPFSNDPRDLPKIQKSAPQRGKDDILDFETALGKLMKAKKQVAGRRGSKPKEENSDPVSCSYNVENSSIADTEQKARHSQSEEDASPPSQMSDVDLAAKAQELLRKHPPDLPNYKMDQETAIELKTVVFGSANLAFNDEWSNQSFTFCDLPRLQYGFYQKKGGPCGVLASIQAAMLQELLFFGKVMEAPPSKLEPTKAERSAALARGLAKVLWRAGEESDCARVVLPKPNPHFIPTGPLKRDGITERLTIYTASNFDELVAFLQFNVGYFEAESNSGVILAFYSAILSRTVEKIKEDMDQRNSTLMGAHGYCTQELVNLLLTGRAHSNVFNDVIELDSGGSGVTLLKGIHGRSDVGLLSLFEHYKSCQVGTFLKTPRFPIWVICSESHFSVLFCLRKQLLSDWRMEKHFDLYYYDGLARQDHEIRLSINTTNRFYKAATGEEEELVPPLEHCIRTKWKDAEVDWNGSEKLL